MLAVLAALVAVSALGAQPDWSAASIAASARIGQPFVLDGLDVQIDRIAPAAAFGDGSPPDTGMRLFEVNFWIHNPLNETAGLYDYFYAYAVTSDGNDTDGDPLSFYSIGGSQEITDITLRPRDSSHARFDLQVTASEKISDLVIFGPIDGTKVVIPL